MDSNHPDPFQDAIQLGLQRAVQLGSCALTAAQVYLYQQRSHARAVAERDEKGKRALNAQIRAEREAARARWAPALDPEWLSHGSFMQTAEAWGAAMPYADRAVPWYQPTAATAMRKCEERLRYLHPYAMARYDRLRADAMSPADAMREAAPLFASPSHAYDAPFTPRRTLAVGNGGPVWTSPPDPQASAPMVEAGVLERRGRQILDAIQGRAREQGRRPLASAEQRTVLETITSLPPEIIDRIVPPDTSAGLARSLGDHAVIADRARAADLDAATDLPATPGTDERTQGLSRAHEDTTTAGAARAQAARTTRPWEHDFPYSIREVVATTTRTSVVAAAVPTPTRVPAQKQAGHGVRR
jgi:hypothetical protein